MSRTVVGSGGPWEARYGYARAVRTGNRVVVSGTTSTGADGLVYGIGDAFTQATMALATIERALTDAGASLSDVVRTRMYVVDRADADAVGRAHASVFGAIRPAATLVIVAGLIHPEHLVEIEVDAEIGSAAAAGEVSPAS
jgi:enamine deaminase RidA (YjgF/YER057c/UK114 family)